MDPNKYTSALVGHDFGFRGRPRIASLATTHGTAAALKAEAPQREHWLAAARSEHDDDKRLAMVKRGMHNEMRRAARKVRAARIRRQGW